MRRMMAATMAVLLAVTGAVVLGASPAAAPPTQDLKISEFRLRGPNGANDEFVEITNVSTVPHTVAGGGTGYALAASNGVARCVIPNGTVLPAGGSYLCVNSVAYSLSGHATGNATYTTDIPDNAGLALFDTSVSGDFTLDHRIDAVGSTSEANTLYKEGVGYPALTPFSIDYSFYRNLTTPSVGNAEITNPTPGIPQDTDDNAADFVFVDTNGTSAGAGQRLGAPGPENLGSPVPHGGLKVGLLDPCVDEDAAPNTVRDFIPDPAQNGTFGTVSFRRTITNTTDAPVTHLRLRIADIRTFPAPQGIADMRPRTSSASAVTVDRAPCGTGTSTITVQGAILEQPPSQPNGGGFNSSLRVGSVSLATPLAPGASVDVNVLTGIQQVGSAAVRVIAEALGGGAPTPVTPVCLGTTTLPGTNMCYPPAPVVTQHPAATTVTVGQTATFTAAATGFETVRWESSDDEGQTWATVPGATSTTLSFTAARAQDGTRYRAVFVNADEAETATNAATLTVEARETSVDVAVDPSDPVRGDAVTLTATVDPDSATGTVQFSVDGTDAGGPVPVVDGQAVSAPIEDLATGPRLAKAIYSGDDDHEGSEGTATFTVAARTTETAVTVEPPAPIWGDPVTFTATVDPPTATGTVQFAVDGVDVGAPVAVVDGEAESAPVTDLAVGERTVAATYSGDDDHTGSSDSAPFTVAARSTTTDLTVDPAEPVVGDPVELTATVGPDSATGTVQFAVDGVDVGPPAPVVDGVAGTDLAAGLAVGERTVTATYSGDESHTGSDDEITVTVARRVTTTSITAVRPGQPVEGDTVELDVTVEPAPAGGTVQLRVDGDDVGEPVAVDPTTGEATLTLPGAPPGELEVVAAYSGDDDHLPSEDDTTVTVITDDTAFVRRAYQVVLGRAADSGGLTYWTGVLEGGASRERVTDGMARLPEGRVRLVAGAYASVLARPADPAGRDYWTGRLASGLSVEDLIVSLAASPEALSRSGGTPEGLVGLLYRVHLGRTGDEAGVAYWADRIGAAGTETARRTVVRAFGRSTEATAVAVRRAVGVACAPGTPVPDDPDLAAYHASTGRNPLRLAGVVLVRHCAPAPPP